MFFFFVVFFLLSFALSAAAAGIVPLPGHLPLPIGYPAELSGLETLCHWHTPSHKKQVQWLVWSQLAWSH